MRTIRQSWVPSLALLAALYGCYQAPSEHGTDSTTHWLRSCGSTAECGGLACVCGVCNTNCTNDAQCHGLDPHAVCTEVAASCTDTVSSCAQGPEGSGGAAALHEDSGAGMPVDAAPATAEDAAAGLVGTTDSACEQPCSMGPVADAGLDAAEGDVEIQSPEPSGLPLLERPSTGDYTCTVSRPISTLAIDPRSATPGVAELGGVGHVFWIDGQTLGYDGPLKTAAVGLDGMLQAAHDVAAPDAVVSSTSPNVRVLAAHDRLTLWWGYNTASSVDPFGALVQLDADGNALTPSRRFAGTPYPYHATLAATPTGFVAAWAEPAPSGCTLTLVELDTNAEVVGARKTLTSLITQQATDGEYPTCAVTAIAKTPDGYGLIYERSRSAGNIFAYQAFDADGAPLAQATRLTPPDSWRFNANLIARGDQVFVAWSVMVGPSLGAHLVSGTLRLARFGANGRLNGPVVALAIPSEFQVDAGALFIDLGDQLGLAWTRDQKLDASCTEGCIHKTFVRYVVLDSADFTPHSTAIDLTVSGPDTPSVGGQLLARNGDDLLVMLSHSTYTDIQGSTGSLLPATPASAALHCVH